MQNNMKTYFQPAYLICVIILVVSAASMTIVIKALGVHLQHEPLALIKSLDLLDANGLGAYKVVKKDKIENQDVLETLGTEQYIEWTLEDTEEPVDSPVRNCSLFITYYPLADKVPHVPEECYTGSGYQRQTSSSETITINKDDEENTIKVRYLEFGLKGENLLAKSMRFSVMYIIRVNDTYADNRNEARSVLAANLFSKHSYFSKVEWKFFGNGKYPSRKEALKSSEKLLTILLTILEKEHWPELEKE